MSAQAKKSYATLQKEFAEECQRLAGECFHRYCRNVSEPLYLIGTKREGTVIWERFSVASEAEVDKREGYGLEYVRPEALPRHLTMDHLASVIRDILSKEPLALFADS